MENFFKQYRTINPLIGGDQTENVLWRANDVILPRSFRPVTIHCSTNNIAANNLHEVMLGNVVIVGLFSNPVQI